MAHFLNLKSYNWGRVSAERTQWNRHTVYQILVNCNRVIVPEWDIETSSRPSIGEPLKMADFLN